MQNKFDSIVTREGRFYVAQCLELGIVSQGKTESEALSNLTEAIELYEEK